VWGAISDGLAQGPLGIDVVGFVLAAWIIQIVRNRQASDSALMFGALTGAIAFSVSATSAGVREFIERQGVDLSLLLAWAGGKACTTAVLAVGLMLVRQIVMGRVPGADAAMTTRVSNRWRMLTE
jgi:hypothetical protein